MPRHAGRLTFAVGKNMRGFSNCDFAIFGFAKLNEAIKIQKKFIGSSFLCIALAKLSTKLFEQTTQKPLLRFKLLQPSENASQSTLVRWCFYLVEISVCLCHGQ